MGFRRSRAAACERFVNCVSQRIPRMKKQEQSALRNRDGENPFLDAGSKERRPGPSESDVERAGKSDYSSLATRKANSRNFGRGAEMKSAPKAQGRPSLGFRAQ